MQFDPNEVCERVANGESLRQIAKACGLKSHANFTQLAQKDAHFASQYARALDDRAELLADQLVDIADDPELDPNDKRVRIDTRKWIASKLKPKKYGDRIQSDVDLAVTVTVVNPFQIAQDAALATIEPQPAIEQDK